MLGLLVASSVVALAMAWAIGAQDVSNALGTSVGSKAITVRQAIFIGAVCEFLGSLAGGSVAATISGGILHVDLFADMGPAGSVLLAMVFFCTMAGAFVWLALATYWALPVSTTHSLIGSLVGIGMVLSHKLGENAVQWDSVLRIVSSWVSSPVMGGVISYAVFAAIHHNVLKSHTPVAAARKALPVITAATMGVLGVFLARTGPVQFRLTVPQATLFGAVCGLAAFVYSFARPANVLPSNPDPLSPMSSSSLSPDAVQLTDVEAGKPRLTARVARTSSTADGGAASTPTTPSRTEPGDDAVTPGGGVPQKKLHTPGGSPAVLQVDVEAAGSGASRNRALEFAEAQFLPLMVTTACVVSFAHGSNDVSNAIGPFQGIAEIYLYGHVAAASGATPLWILVCGGAGIVLGLATFGYKVMATVGEKIAKLSFSRGYAAQIACATTVLTASQIGVSVSTTHCLIGAIAGVALVEGTDKLNYATLRKIGASWVITLPASALFAVVLFLVLSAERTPILM